MCSASDGAKIKKRASSAVFSPLASIPIEGRRIISAHECLWDFGAVCLNAPVIDRFGAAFPGKEGLRAVQYVFLPKTHLPWMCAKLAIFTHRAKSVSVAYKLSLRPYVKLCFNSSGRQGGRPCMSPATSRPRRIQSTIWHTELSAKRLKYYVANTQHSDGRDVNLHFWRDGQK